jgi:hypothetical protein
MASKKEGFGRGGSAHRLNKADRDRILKRKKESRANPSQVKTSIKSSKKAKPAVAAAAVQKPGKKDSVEAGKQDKAKILAEKASSAEAAKANKAADKTDKADSKINVETDYRTILDEIYEFVEQQGEITLTALSKKTGILPARLEEWAKVFDKDKLLELDYPMMGDIIIRKVGYAEEQKKAKHPDKKAKAAEGQAVKDAKTNADAAKQVNSFKAETEKLASAKADAAKAAAPKLDAAKAASAAKKDAAPKPELTEEEKKQKRKKAMRLAMFGIGAVIVALIGVLVYFLIKSGYIQFV